MFRFFQLLLFLAPCCVLAAAERPNFVFFLADDLGQRDLGCYGSTFYETPNIDQLARDGLRFTNAYAACPVCSPTRASILTGKYPQRTGITDYIGAPLKPDLWKRNTMLLPAPYRDRLALEEVTVAKALKRTGYATFSPASGTSVPRVGIRRTTASTSTKAATRKAAPTAGKSIFLLTAIRA